MGQIFQCIGQEVNGVRALVLCGWEDSAAHEAYEELRGRLAELDPEATPSRPTVYLDEEGGELLRSCWVVRATPAGDLVPVGSRAPEDRCWLEATRLENYMAPARA